MKYIYPHTDPEILKLGIRMALYDEPMPESPATGATQRMLGIYNLRLKEWWKNNSRIAYLKETEFKAGDAVYHIRTSKEFILDEIDNQGIWGIRRSDKKRIYISDTISHYYPGQEWDGDIKYVREEMVNAWDFDAKKDVFEWQEVEEPAEDNPYYMKPYYVEGGYAGEEFDRKEFETEYIQFKEGVNKGKIIAEI